MYIFNAIACTITMMWAVWAALSTKVQDGICGKIIFAAIAISSLAVLLGPTYGYRQPQTAEMTLNVCFAAYCVRYVFMKYAWPWIVDRLCCPECPLRDKFHHDQGD